MDNGVESPSASNLVKKAMDNEVMDSKVKEKAAVASHKSKNLEGAKDFVDSIAAKVSSVYSEDVVMNSVKDVDNSGDGKRSMAAHEKADSGVDFEKFEEAAETPIDVDNQAGQSTGIEDNGEVFMGVERVDKPMVMEKTDGVVNDVAEGKQDGESSMTAHERTNSGTDFEKFEEALEVPIDVYNQKQSAKVEANGGLSVFVKRVDKPMVHIVSNVEGLREKTDAVENDVAERKQEDGGIVASDICNSVTCKEIKEDKEVVEVDISDVLDKEIKNDVIAEKHEDIVPNDVDLEETPSIEISVDGPTSVEEVPEDEEQKTAEIVMPVYSDSMQLIESLDRAEKIEELKKIMSSLDNGQEGKESNECEGHEASGITTNRVEEANHNSVPLNAKLEGEKNIEGVKEEIFESPNMLHENGTREEMGTVSLAEENLAENSEKLARDLATSDLDHHLTNGKHDSSVEEREVTPYVQKLPDFEQVAVETVEKVQDNAPNTVVDRAEVSQPQPAVKSIDSANVDTKKDTIVEAKVEEAKQNTQGQNGTRETKPISDVYENPTPPPARPAGLGRTAPLLETAPRVVQQPRANGASSHMQNQIVDDSANGEVEEMDETREKLQMIRVKFLRLAHRLGQTPHNVVVAQVLYRLGLAEQLRGRNGGRVAGFTFDRASAMAEQLEATGQEPLDFSCTIMVLGKSGVGKSATINSIFDEVKFGTDAFQRGTKKVQDVVGTVQGIKVRVIDTPGLLPLWSDQRHNEKILLSVKRFIKKSPPDIILYVDRLDMQTRDLGDMPLLKTISDIFGRSIWFNAIVVLTHAASAPPDGPHGTATSYDMFVTNRSHVVQQEIRQAAGDMRLMNPVSLVENHSACRKNRAGQRVLPNGQIWKAHLLLLSFASKILAEANTLLKLQDSPPGQPFLTRTRAPPLPFLLSSLLQSRAQLKLPEEQFGGDDAFDEDMDESSDSDNEPEYDELPPFKRLTKDQLGKLTKDQREAYFTELEYREKLFMKKQLKEEKKRRQMMKKMAASTSELASEFSGNAEEDSGGAASVPVPMPDLALPASFDSDNPTHRYRYLDSPNQWVVRPVLDSHGWDHDIGYEGVNVEKLFVVKEKIPMSFSGQITKDKKDANMQMEIASTIKHGEGKATSLGLDMQSLGKDLAYTLRTETKFCNYRKNKATAGLSVTMLGDTVSAGVKFEDKLVVNKRLRVVASGGAMTGRGDVAYGGSFEATLRDKDHPLGRSLSTLGLSVMDWHGDLAIGGNIQSQIPVGRSSNLIARANLNNKGSGQVSIRLNSSEQLQIALIALIPLLKKAFDHVQLSQFGQ